MKKVIIGAFMLPVIGSTVAIAATNTAPDFLAKKGVIEAHYGDVSAYNLNSNITRREMLKVMMNLSGKNVTDTCAGKFSDMKAGDWGCKYAESALNAGYIAKNKNFRPNDKVTQIEALKMIMQAKGIEKNTSDDWREGYVTKAKSEGLLSSDIVYDKSAIRNFIFNTAAMTYSDAPDLSTSVTNTKTNEEYNGEQLPEDVAKEVEVILEAALKAVESN